MILIYTFTGSTDSLNTKKIFVGNKKYKSPAGKIMPLKTDMAFWSLRTSLKKRLMTEYVLQQPYLPVR